MAKPANESIVSRVVQGACVALVLFFCFAALAKAQEYSPALHDAVSTQAEGNRL